MKRLILFLFIVCSLQSCSKHSSDVSINKNAKVILSITYKVDSQPLIFDSIMFMNNAGDQYSVERLQYYLSGIKLYKGGRVKYHPTDVLFIDARDTVTKHELTITGGLETGTYDSISFYLGIDSAHNISNSLPATMDNIQMGWPDAMGGGYHFFKMEGHWLDSTGESGFALHVGGNGYQVPFRIFIDSVVQQSGNMNVHLVMNVNEWFRNPAIYDFRIDGVFSMGDTILMKKLQKNGADVFTTN